MGEGNPLGSRKMSHEIGLEKEKVFGNKIMKVKVLSDEISRTSKTVILGNNQLE